MKNILFALCMAACFAGCSNESATPTATIDGMLAAMKMESIDSMKKYITRSDAAMIEAAEKILTAVNPGAVSKIKEKIITEMKTAAGGIQYKLKSQKINGDNATVEADVTHEGKTTAHTFELVKEDGAWKIALSKPGNDIFNSMKGNLGNEKPDLRTGLEKLEKMDKDTLKMILDKGAQALDSLDSLDAKTKKKE